MMPDGRHPGFFESFTYAVAGLRAALARERNFKVMLAVGALALVAGFILRLDALSWVAVVLMIGLVLGAELFNTAIETVVDHVTPQVHPLAKLIKDLAAGAVLVISASVAVAGLVIYIRAALLLWGAGM